MTQPSVLITGSCGLIGSEVAMFFARQGFRVTGIDNNHRAVFFGPEGDTSWMLAMLREQIPGYRHASIDIRDRAACCRWWRRCGPNLIIHTAAQPSHDRAAAIPFLDFEVNALGTLHLLEAARQSCPESPFIHMSTNKVYGDRPNTHPAQGAGNALGLRRPGFRERHRGESSPSISPSTRSSAPPKWRATSWCRSTGATFNMPTCCLRGGCLTGPNHSGVELHGFLSYLIKCNLEGREYKVYGYKGKQVRDNIHAEDVARFMFEFWKAPRVAEVYNLGGGKGNSCSILEAFEMAEAATGQPMRWQLRRRESRRATTSATTATCARCSAHYPAWDITVKLEDIFQQIAAGWAARRVAIRT